MRLRTLHLNDTHFVHKNPVSRVDDANEELFVVLDQVGQLARRFQVKAICHAGDWFQDPARVPWPVLFRLVAWAAALRKDGVQILSIPGNHDLKHDRYESLPELPLGALFGTGLILDVSRQAVYLSGQGSPAIYGVPWPDGLTPMSEYPVPAFASTVMVHGFGTPEGVPRYGVFCHKYEDLAAAAPHVRIWHFGHDHSDHGVMRLSNGAFVINVGALSRGSLDTDNLLRAVKVALVTHPEHQGQLYEVQQVALRLPPVEQVFDLKARDRKKVETQAIEAFVAQLAQGMGSLMTVDYKQILQGLQLDVAVRQKVDAYIAQAETVA